MLDEKGNLWLIEINRGPDIKGLVANIGEKACQDMFDEIFKISIDPHYVDKDNINKDSVDNDTKLKYFDRVLVDYKTINKY